MRTLMMLAAVASLAACNRDGGRDRDRDRDRNRSERSDRDADRDRNSAEDSRPSGPASGASDAALEAEIAREVQGAQASLPREAGGGVTLERMEAHGTVLDFTLRTRMPLDQSRLDLAREGERTNMCRQPQTREWFRRGARFNYHIIDSAGENFEFSFDSCPA